MEITVQEILVGLIVAAAAIYAGRKTFKQFVPGVQEDGCGKCGCSAPSQNTRGEKKKRIALPKHFPKSNASHMS